MSIDLDIHDEPCTAAQILPGGRCVVLMHALPDGSSHFDWLLETDVVAAADAGDDARTLAAFRSPYPPDEMQTHAETDLHAIAPHRRRYLHYQGPLSNNRGEVRRVRSGRIEKMEVLAMKPPRMSLRVRWEDAPGRRVRSQDFRLTRDAAGGARWRLCCVRAESGAE